MANLRTVAAAVAFLLLASSLPANARSSARKHTQRADRVWKSTKASCEQQGSCAAMHPDERDNCVNECTSKACYQQIYAAEPVS